MAIGEFGGAPAAAGDAVPMFRAPTYWFYEMRPGTQSVACRRRRRGCSGLPRPGTAAFGKTMAASLELFERSTATASRNGTSPPPWWAASACRCTSSRGSGPSAACCISSAPSSTCLAVRSRACSSSRRCRALPDAAARHRRGLPAQPRRLHHRVGRRAHGAGFGGPLRSRRLHRLSDLDPASARRRHPHHSGVPALGAGARGGRAHGGRERSLRTPFHGADGRADRHAGQSDGGQQSWRRRAASTGSAATSSPRCRSRTRASCATSIRASCNCTAS